MKTCPKCKSPNPDQAHYCNGCGAQLMELNFFNLTRASKCDDIVKVVYSGFNPHVEARCDEFLTNKRKRLESLDPATYHIEDEIELEAWVWINDLEFAIDEFDLAADFIKEFLFNTLMVVNQNIDPDERHLAIQKLEDKSFELQNQYQVQLEKTRDLVNALRSSFLDVIR